MICCDFETVTHGKWILAGEHAVLRGHPAIVFPIHEKKLTLSYQHSKTELSIDHAGGSDLLTLLRKILNHGLSLLGRAKDGVPGHFHLQSNIPVGVGLGASAALCVAIARWFVAQQLLSQAHVLHFAKELEHLFHGKSSGLDIAGVAAESGIYFQQTITTPITSAWQPKWFLSNCGQVGVTSKCINAVKNIWEINPQHAETIDQQMHTSVLDAKIALEDKSLCLLTKAINNASDCFQQWGLIYPALQHHMQHLRNQGALAVKPTGSGGGGYVLSLWDTTPRHTLNLTPI